MEYTEETEPARIFQKWTGMCVLASALRKKVNLSLGRIRVYPNLYVVFVAEPGQARKSQSIDFGLDIMSQIPEIITSADSVTREAILEDLETCAVDEQMLDGSTFRHSSLSIISREFESFLGQKKDNTKMVVLLTDLFDCKELPWKYRTKHSGTNIIPSIFVNLLAATTPDSIASCLPSTAIGGGLTSRILFVWAERKYKKVTFPPDTPAIRSLKESLVKDLYLISRISGQYLFSPEAARRWNDWYNEYEELDPRRICKDPSFNGWYSRKPTYILKVAISCAAAKSNNLLLEWEHISESMECIIEVERDMGRVFRAVGRSTVTAETDNLLQIIKVHKFISEKKLMSMVWRDMDAMKFDNVVNTCIKTGKVVRKFSGPKGETGIWYAYFEDVQKV
jgi:hypothetical protein